MEIKGIADCEVISGLIIEYIDGELDVETADIVSHHIDSCADCRKLYRDLKVVCLAAAKAAYKAPDELHSRVMSSIEAQKSARLRRVRFMRRQTTYGGLGIAAMLCICIGVMSILSSFDNFNLLKESASADEDYQLYQHSFNFSRSSKISPLESNNSTNVVNDGYRDDDTKDSEFGDSYVATEAEAAKEQVSTALEFTECPQASVVQGTGSTDCMFGEWILSVENGKMIILNLYSDFSFILSDADNNVITGSYIVGEGVISFTYLGGTAEYEYGNRGGVLGLSYLSGNEIIK